MSHQRNDPAAETVDHTQRHAYRAKSYTVFKVYVETIRFYYDVANVLPTRHNRTTALVEKM